METMLHYLLLIALMTVWIWLAKVYGRHQNKVLLAENERLLTENKIYTKRLIQAGLELSKLEKDLMDERKQKSPKTGFDFLTANRNNIKILKSVEEFEISRQGGLQ